MYILEYVQHGNLRKFLRKYRKDSKGKEKPTDLSPTQLLSFAIGVAKGMKHIADCGVRKWGIFLKFGCVIMIKIQLAEHFMQCFQEGRVPDNWCNAIIILLYKKMI